MTLATRLRDRLAAARPVPLSTQAYAPVFFNEWEWSFLLTVIETVVPDDEDSSRDVSGVPSFIDRRMGTSSGYESSWRMLVPFLSDVPPVLDHQMRFPLRDLYRRGIAVSIEVFFEETGRDFAEASETERCSFLLRLAAGRGNVCCQAFFRQLLADIKLGSVKSSC